MGTGGAQEERGGARERGDSRLLRGEGIWGTCEREGVGWDKTGLEGKTGGH